MALIRVSNFLGGGGRAGCVSIRGTGVGQGCASLRITTHRDDRRLRTDSRQACSGMYGGDSAYINGAPDPPM